MEILATMTATEYRTVRGALERESLWAVPATGYRNRVANERARALLRGLRGE